MTDELGNYTVEFSLPKAFEKPNLPSIFEPAGLPFSDPVQTKGTHELKVYLSSKPFLLTKLEKEGAIQSKLEGAAFLGAKDPAFATHSTSILPKHFYSPTGLVPVRFSTFRKTLTPTPNGYILYDLLTQVIVYKTGYAVFVLSRLVRVTPTSLHPYLVLPRHVTSSPLFQIDDLPPIPLHKLFMINTYTLMPTKIAKTSFKDAKDFRGRLVTQVADLLKTWNEIRLN